MGWASAWVQQLQKGKTVQFRPRGNSMQPKVPSGKLCTVEPVDEQTIIEVGNVVLCKVNGEEYLHLVKAVGSDGQYQIGNNKGRNNGWIAKDKIYGRRVKVED